MISLFSSSLSDDSEHNNIETPYTSIYVPADRQENNLNNGRPKHFMYFGITLGIASIVAVAVWAISKLLENESSGSALAYSSFIQDATYICNRDDRNCYYEWTESGRKHPLSEAVIPCVSRLSEYLAQYVMLVFAQSLSFSSSNNSLIKTGIDGAWLIFKTNYSQSCETTINENRIDIMKYYNLTRGQAYILARLYQQACESYANVTSTFKEACANGRLHGTTYQPLVERKGGKPSNNLSSAGRDQRLICQPTRPAP